MEVDRGGSTDSNHPDGRWRVRIRHVDGGVLGVGLLVPTGQVLTCAHVISSDTGESPPEEPVVVEFVDLPGIPTRTASVAAGGWFPPSEDNGGDVALLELAGGVPAGTEPAAPLRRLPMTLDRQVRIYGFPDGAEKPGLWVRAVLYGPADRASEWVQMRANSADDHISPGFSGAAVVDEASGAVIGMTVSRFLGRPGMSWMLPVETILRYLPGLKEGVRGGVAVDPGLLPDPGSRIDVGLAKLIARWFARQRVSGDVRNSFDGKADAVVQARDVSGGFHVHLPGGTDNVVLIVPPAAGSDVSSVLRRVVRQADRESHRPGEVTGAPPPPPGSVDLAIDAAGKTVAEVERRIADRVAIDADQAAEVGDRVRAETPPLTMVVDGVDEAADPEALITEVMAPLVRRGARLMLTFRQDTSRSLELARSLLSQPPEPDASAEFGRRLDALAERVADVADREHALRRRREEVAARIASVPEVPEAAIALRLRLSEIRRAGPATGLSEVDGFGAAVDRAARRLDRRAEHFDRLLARRGELRGRLDALHAKAVDRGLAEDDDLDVIYRRARAQLWDGVCDLVVADRLARDYQAAIRRKGNGR